MLKSLSEQKQLAVARVFDILECGPRNQFWANGKIVSNCNFQNMPTSTKDYPMAGELRKSILAPKGHVIIAPDSAQIEARVLAWIAGHEELLTRFRNKEDVYKFMASLIYNVPVEEIDSEQRFIGKLCLAKGTLIYSDRGWIKIETLRPTDKLWDGDNWVCHSGLVMNGYKETLNLSGLWLTPDHLVWSGTEWKEAQYLERDAKTLYQALGTAAASSPSRAIYGEYVEALRRSLSSAAAEAPNTPSTAKISKISEVRDAIVVPRKRRLSNAIGNMRKQCLKMITARDYSTASQQLLPGVIQNLAKRTYIMERGEFRYLTTGEKIVLFFSNMHERLLGGTIRLLTWIEQTLIKDISPEISDSLRDRLMEKTSGVLPTLRKNCRVYDVLSVGPKNRFLALTTEGPLLVHNCVLGLGYAMGAKRFQTTLALGVMGPPMVLTMLECTKIVKMYRKINKAIVDFWAECENVLEAMCNGQSGTFGNNGLLEYDGTDIWLPNGMGLHYPGLKMTWDAERNRRSGFSYMSAGVKKHIYGGLLAENIVQALAGVVIREEMTEVHDYYAKLKLRKGEVAKIATMTHDEIVSVVPERIAKKCLDTNLKIMQTPPAWAPDMPIWAAAEAGWAPNYSV